MGRLDARLRVRAFALATGALVVAATAACELLVATEEYALASDAGGSDGTHIADTSETDSAADGNETGALTIGNLESIATGQAGPRSVTVDDTDVYWVNAVDGAVTKAPKSGGAPTIIGTAVRPRWLALDATQVFWSNDTQGGCVVGVLKKAKSAAVDASATAIISCTDTLSRVNGFGVDGAFVYWTTHPSVTSLFAVPKESGGSVALASALGGQPDALAVTSAAIHWINPPLETVSRYDKSTQAVTTVAGGLKGLSAITADATHVYFSTTTNVFRIAATAHVEAGDAPETIASAQDAPISLALFGPHLYWVNAGSGTVMRAPLAGGAPETLASGQAGARSVTVDATGVYFTRDTGEVARLPAR